MPKNETNLLQNKENKVFRKLYFKSYISNVSEVIQIFQKQTTALFQIRTN